MEIICNNEAETYELGIKLGEILKAGMILSLNGDLGAGKTHLTKGIAKGLNIEEYITSPSFTIVNEYDGRLQLYHFDVYRIDDINEMYELGFEEYLYGTGVCIIEWGELVRDILPDTIIDIKITRLTEDIRQIIIQDFGILKELKL